MESFKEKRLQKERGKSPKQALETLLKKVDDIENMVVIYDKENGDIETVVSCDNTLEALGMLEIGKQDTLQIMYDAYHDK